MEIATVMKGDTCDLPRGWRLSCVLAYFTRSTIPEENKGVLVVIPEWRARRNVSEFFPLFSYFLKEPSVLELAPTPAPVRVKGGMSLRNGLWHGLRNDIIMRNVVYSEWPKEIDLSSPCFNVAGPTYDDNKKTTMAHCRLVFFAQPQRFFLPLLVGMNGSTYTTSRKSAIEEKIFWKVTLPFYKLREKCYFFRRWLTWSWHNFRDAMDVVFCFLGCEV